MSGDDNVCAALACGRRAMFRLGHRTLTTGPRETCGQHIAAGIREIGAIVGDGSKLVTVKVTPLAVKR